MFGLSPFGLFIFANPVSPDGANKIWVERCKVITEWNNSVPRSKANVLRC